MDWLTVIGFILFGTFLVIAEIVFVPGTTIVGILGFIFSIYGIYLGFDYFGTVVGVLILIVGIVLNIASLVIAFKGKTWQRLSLKNINSAKVNDDFKFDVQVGEKGKTLSSLKPIGKAIFHEQEMEVRSNGEYLKENLEIEIFRIESNKIFVKPINQINL